MHGRVTDEGVCVLVIEKSCVVFGTQGKGRQANTTVIEKEFCEGPGRDGRQKLATLDPRYGLQATSLGSYSPRGPQGGDGLWALMGFGRCWQWVAGLSVMIWAPLTGMYDPPLPTCVYLVSCMSSPPAFDCGPNTSASQM